MILHGVKWLKYCRYGKKTQLITLNRKTAFNKIAYFLHIIETFAKKDDVGDHKRLSFNIVIAWNKTLFT